MNKHRDKNAETIWIPFPKELENSQAIISLTYHRGNEDRKIYSLGYYTKPIPPFKEYQSSLATSFTLSEYDVSFSERVARIKSKFRELVGELRELAK